MAMKPSEEEEEEVGRRNRRAKAPPIQDLLKRGQEILVQVSKEPISTKGPRVTAQVSLAGRFLVFMPFASRVGVSRKIGERAERQRLRELVQAVLPEDSGGVIVRTVGRGRHAGDLPPRAGLAAEPVEEDQAEDALPEGARRSCTARRR